MKETTVRVRYYRLVEKSAITNSHDSWVVELYRPALDVWEHRSHLLYRDMAVACAVRLLEEYVLKGDEDVSASAS